MKKLWELLIAAGVVFVLLSFVAACSFPPIGTSGTGTDTGTGTGAGSESSTAPGNTDGAPTILIPSTTFWMGSEPGDALADEDEKPYHKVSLHEYEIYTQEVTNGMYASCVEAGGCIPIEVHETGPTTHYDDPAYADHPVVGVDWNMAAAYCAWANARLPTEAEWELAARGDQSLVYPWGADVPSCDMVNMLGCLVPPDTLSSGSLALGNSPYGLQDMSGNVWEWVQDWYDADYYVLSPQADPLGPNMGELKVARGGGLKSEPVQMRSAVRVGGNPARSYDDVGFRCVVGDLSLPAAYEPVPPVHVWSPPDPLDPGEDLEDPDEDTPWFSMGSAEVSCPDSEGIMHVVAEVDSSGPVEYEMVVNGNPFTCFYDEMLRLVQCEGPIPDNNDELDEYDIDVFFNPGGIAHFYPDRPLGCEEEVPPGGEDWIAEASCPEDGWVTLLFHYTPQTTWTSTRLDGADVTCWPFDEHHLYCLVPPRPEGEHYDMELIGTRTDGISYVWSPIVPAASGCPDEMREVRVAAQCYENHPVAVVSVLPTSLEPENILINGVPPASCIGMAPGEQYCGDLSGAPGSEAVVTVCLPGDPCGDYPVTVPECPGGGGPLLYSIVSVCQEGLGPVAVITYVPSDQPLVAANANGADLTCTDVPGGWVMCYTLPGSPGAEMTITFCLEDGSCYSQPITVLDCTEDTTSTDWRLSAMGCHDEGVIYFILDTGLEWLVPGAAYTYSASDGEVGYSCEVHPAIPGRLYCAGARPASAGTLQFCLQQDGTPSPTCASYPDWPAWVVDIPPCTATIPAEPVLACTDYTDRTSCLANACKWTKGPPDFHEHCYNP